MKSKAKNFLPKLIAVILAVISLFSMFNLGILGIYDGVPGNIEQPSKGTTKYAINSIDGNGKDFVFGYRFSVIDAYGITQKNSGKFRTIDLLRTGNDRANTAFNEDETNKLSSKRNKYQLYELYINNKNINVNYGGNSSSDTYGIKQASGYSTALGSVESVEAWMNRSDNRAKLLNALGYSNANQDNVRELLGSNRIVIEPLFRIKMNGVYLLLTATEAAVVSDAYEITPKGDEYAIGQYTNKFFPESLRITDNLNIPKDKPLKVVSPKTGDAANANNRWTHSEVIENGLGVALYYEKVNGKPVMPVTSHTLKVIYHTNYGTDYQYSNEFEVKSADTKIGIYGKQGLFALNAVSGNQFSRPDYAFAYWTTNKDGSGKKYDIAGRAQEYKASELNANAAKQDTTINLYAQWSTTTIAVYFHGNYKSDDPVFSPFEDDEDDTELMVYYGESEISSDGYIKIHFPTQGEDDRFVSNKYKLSSWSMHRTANIGNGVPGEDAKWIPSGNRMDFYAHWSDYNKLIVKYRTDGLDTTKLNGNYSVNSGGFLTKKDGTVFSESWTIGDNADMDKDPLYHLTDPEDFGLKPKPGFRWSLVKDAQNSDGTEYRSWRMYSYTKEVSIDNGQKYAVIFKIICRIICKLIYLISSIFSPNRKKYYTPRSALLIQLTCKEIKIIIKLKLKKKFCILIFF